MTCSGRAVFLTAGGAAISFLLGLLTSIAGFPAVADHVRTVEVVSWGGASADSPQKASIDPYRAVAPNVEISLVNAGG